MMKMIITTRSDITTYTTYTHTARDSSEKQDFKRFKCAALLQPLLKQLSQ